VADLQLRDILDVRAYERVRDGYRREVMALKARRRIALGPLMTIVFECFETVRFQVQEMARVERIATDEGLQSELDVYNRLLPTPGELSATLFIELVTPEDLRRWLPALVGVERAIEFDLASAGGKGHTSLQVRSEPEAEHGEALVRHAVTSAVHYLRFSFSPSAVRAMAGGGAALAVDHPQYQFRAELDQATVDELRADLAGREHRVPIEEFPGHGAGSQPETSS
jgi:hypothetical protein